MPDRHRRLVIAVAVLLGCAAALCAFESRLDGGPAEARASTGSHGGLANGPRDDAEPGGPTTVASVASGTWSSSPLTVAFSTPGWDPAQVVTYRRLDGGDWTAGVELLLPAPNDHGNDGRHVIEFFSTDLEGLAGPTAAIEIGIDTRRPGFRWRRLSPNPVGDRRYIRAVFGVRDISPRLRVSYIVEDAWGRRAARKTGISRRPGRCVVAVPLRYGGGGRLLPGLYRVTFTVADRAGNRVTSRTRVFRVHRPVTPGVWRRVGGAGKRVALTFDDGYSGAAWSSILSTLRANGVHATFFVNGVHVSGYPALARRTVAAGHAIGSHTYSHALLTRVGPARAYQEVVNDRSVWWRVARASPLPFMRPPYGDYDASTLRAVGQAGYARVILWDVDPADWQSPSASTIVQRVLAGVRPGSIVLMHLQPNTAAALPAILRGLRSRGLQPVTLPVLFRAAGAH